jgi:hypothetical protein
MKNFYNYLNKDGYEVFYHVKDKKKKFHVDSGKNLNDDLKQIMNKLDDKGVMDEINKKNSNDNDRASFKIKFNDDQPIKWNDLKVILNRIIS